MRIEHTRQAAKISAEDSNKETTMGQRPVTAGSSQPAALRLSGRANTFFKLFVVALLPAITEARVQVRRAGEMSSPPPVQDNRFKVDTPVELAFMMIMMFAIEHLLRRVHN